MIDCSIWNEAYENLCYMQAEDLVEANMTAPAMMLRTAVNAVKSYKKENARLRHERDCYKETLQAAAGVDAMAQTSSVPNIPDVPRPPEKKGERDGRG